MVEINLEPIEEISEEEVIEELRNYAKRGYSWRLVNFNISFNKYEFYIWKPNNESFLTSQGIVRYFKNLKKLEIGNKEQIEMKKCLDLIGLLLTAQKLYKPSYHLSPYIISSEKFFEEGNLSSF